jgi:diacylglycerol kinase (ATP)
MAEGREQHDKQDANALKGTHGIRRIYNAFQYSMAGFAAVFKDEAAFRQLCVLNAVLIPIAFMVEVSAVERVVLVLTPLFCLVVELLNSAVENVVDRISMELHPLSKKAKDMGSAAQLVAMTMVALAWLIILTATYAG